MRQTRQHVRVYPCSLGSADSCVLGRMRAKIPTVLVSAVCGFVLGATLVSVLARDASAAFSELLADLFRLLALRAEERSGVVVDPERYRSIGDRMGLGRDVDALRKMADHMGDAARSR